MIILLTGAAGFIGFHAAKMCLSQGHHVIGVDSLNEYYDIGLKRARLAHLQSFENFEFHTLDIADERALDGFHDRGVTHILHLAAQAGVRYSIENPRSYGRSNVIGHLEVLEFARHCDSLQHLVYASSSSVYGERDSGAFTETDRVRSPSSLYAATKISGEILAQSYTHLYNIPQTALRFFTVYGPWGRPDMAYFIFTQKILRGEAITLFAPQLMQRDFTFIDDISEIIPTILQTPSSAHDIYNLGRANPYPLMDLVKAVERACGKTATLEIKPKQNGDVSSTFADIDAAKQSFGFNPKTDLETGIARFVDWYRAFYAA
ncbi:MAG: NAD-dependent epimerase/dehydratase family protein [Litorimonas sp.]